MDRIDTVQFPCRGGLITNMDSLQQGRDFPGSAIKLVNYEPAISGGYSRILGYTKYDSNEVTGTGDILGAFVFGNLVIACRNDGVYTSSGTGWTLRNGASLRTGAEYYKGVHYDFMGSELFCIVDSVNKPAKIASNGTYTLLSNAPTGATCVAEFRGRLWFGVGNTLIYSAPNDDTDYTAASGAGEINVSHTITGLRMFRDSLVVFCDTAILRIIGDSEANFEVSPVSHNVGCQYPDTIVEANGDLFYCSADGLRTFAGTERNDDFNLDNVAQQIQNRLVDFLNNYERIVAVTIRKKNQIRLFGYSPSAPGVPGAGFIATLTNINGSRQWELSEINGMSIIVAYSDYTDSDIELLVFGNSDGFIYQAETGNSFDGAAINSIYQTPYLSLQDVKIRKSFRKLNIFFGDTSEYDLQVYLKLDFDGAQIIQPPPFTLTYSGGNSYYYGTAVYGSATYGGGSINTPEDVVMTVGAGYVGSFIFTGADTNSAHTIKSLAVELSTYGRK